MYDRRGGGKWGGGSGESGSGSDSGCTSIIDIPQSQLTN